MAIYLLDGNILTDLEYPDTPSYHVVMNRFSALSEDDQVCFSIISAYEYQHGMAKAPESIAANLKKAWATFLDLFAVVPLTLEGAEMYGVLKASYEKHTGMRKKEAKRHTADLVLAATALEIGAVLVSDDQIFDRIQEIEPALQLENWKEEK